MATKKVELEAAEAVVENVEETVEKKPARKTTARKTTKKAADAETTEKKTTRRTTKKAAAETETAEKKTTVKKTTTRRKKAKEVNTEVYVQFWGKEVYAKDLVAEVKRLWVEELGREEAEMEDIKVYIKPEDNGAHFLVNGEITGFIAL